MYRRRTSREDAEARARLATVRSAVGAFARRVVACIVVLGCATTAHAAEAIRLKIVGGLAGVRQYTQLEEPFWLVRMRELSRGRIEADIHPFDRSGLRGQDMLQLMRLGVVPFGTALLALVTGEEPEFNAVDLPGLSPDMATLRRNVAEYRPHLRRVLHERFDVELLGIYTYPAQVVFCTKPFRGLDDLAGRRVRTSSVGQSEMMTALGAVPVQTPFSEIVTAVSTGVVDCAITGTLSGNEVGLTNVTSHVHAMAINWGLSFFGANTKAWQAVPEDLRDVIRTGIGQLEADIWEMADRETAGGLACNTGAPACAGGRPASLQLVPVTPADDARRRRLLVEAILPAWVQRCGTDCVTAWNATLARTTGIKVSAD